MRSRTGRRSDATGFVAAKRSFAYLVSVLEILTFDHPTLRKVSKTIKEIDDEIITLAENMVETMVESKGIGLAANQVGVLKRLIIIQIDETPQIFINPKILKRCKEISEDNEGCLSFPNWFGTVKRNAKIRVTAYNINLKKIVLDVENLIARAFQHEIDHLNGIVFTERTEPDTLKEIFPENKDAPPQPE